MRGVALTLLAFAVVALLLAWSRRLARRRAAALGHVVLAAVCATLAAAVLYGSSAVDGYRPIHAERPIAEIRFDADRVGLYSAMLLRLPEGRVQVLALPGDHWRITVHTIEGTAYAARLGLRPSARLYTLESAGAGRELRAYRLTDGDSSDAWDSAVAGGGWSRVVTAGAADTGWQPMTDGGEYRLRLAGGRLLVEPVPDGAGLAR